MELHLRTAQGLRGRARVPGDKSISHRIVMLGALGDADAHIGALYVGGFLPARDCLATVACMRALGASVEAGPGATDVTVRGAGLRGLRAPAGPLDCGGSGTTMRLLAGLLAGHGVRATLAGNAQLARRPMARVADPLRAMGAQIALGESGRPPIALAGNGPLHGIDYALPMPSAQVKSALLLAGLYADGATVVREPAPARDHTERMLRAFGATVGREDGAVTIERAERLVLPEFYNVPGDFSSAAFLLVAALLVPGSQIALERVGFNPTRTGLYDVLQAMGADLGWLDSEEEHGEASVQLRARASGLRGTRVDGELVPRTIDEFPVLAVAATQAEGVTEVRDAAELRVKETDRIAALVEELRKLGARIEALDDGFVVEGPARLRGARVGSHGDHRLAMALAVAGLVADGETVVEDTACIDDSYPGFAAALAQLGAEVRA
jgi:3-phosphoshikimate 1-carboxyvinyltransferase